MPEIGEVARVVARLNKHVAGKTIAAVQTTVDTLVYKDTSAAAFSKAMTGRSVVAAKQWGKYFWLVMDQPPHPLMHLGMTGWVHIKDDPLGHYKAAANADAAARWPPKATKFVLQLSDSANEVAFVDARRLARIRLLDHPDGHGLRHVPPLAENGPDPVQEPVALEWLAGKLGARRVPVKAWLLDQRAIAGIGNWVGDEILFQARVHPEARTNALTAPQVERLHAAIAYVCRLAVETGAESARFPKDWLMLHRWGKGKKTASRLPGGERIEFVTVGGRTSAFVPSLQRKMKLPTNAKKKKKKKGKAAEESVSEDGEMEEFDG